LKNLVTRPYGSFIGNEISALLGFARVAFNPAAILFAHVTVHTELAEKEAPWLRFGKRPFPNGLSPQGGSMRFG